MRCHEARRLMHLYLDSELSTESSFEVAQHLEECPDCAAMFERERTLENNLRDRLLERLPGDDVLWDEALRKAGRRSRTGLPRWGSTAFLAAAAAVVAVLVFALWPRVHPDLDLARAAEADHARFLTELAEDEAPPSNLGALGEIVNRTLHGTPSVPAQPPQGYGVIKVGHCRLNGAQVAYVVIARQGEPVSLFLMDRADLERFPRAAVRLAREPDGVICNVSRRSFFARAGSDWVACGVGEIDSVALRSLVAWFLPGS